jgi:uncharacterized protein (TIGR02246 family)
VKTITAALLVLALALASACGPRVNDPADVQAITQLMEGYFKSASAKDPAALHAVLSDQTILFEPHMAPLVGKDAIGKMHEAFMGQFGIDAKGPVAGVRVVGDLAVAHGSYAETITPKDETLAAERASGHWMAALQRQAGGAWKWDWVMANSDQPMPGMTADGAEERALLDIERGFIAAAKTRDMAYFDRVLAKEYTQTVDGRRVNFAAQLAELKAGHMQVESMELRDMRAHVFGEAAIVSIGAVATGAYRGKPFNEKTKGVDFFVKRDGRWQAVYSEMTTIKE